MNESEAAERQRRVALHDGARSFAAERVIAVGRSQVAWWLVLAALLVLGVWFRFALLDRKVYFCDEVGTSLRIAGYTLAEVMFGRERRRHVVDDVHEL